MTGRLAEHSLRQVLASLAPAAAFEPSIEVLPITVAALMTPAWIAARWRVPPDAQRVILPGYCQGDDAPLRATTSAQVEFGPRDVRRLPEYFLQAAAPSDYGRYDIEILAEINNCPRLSLAEILAQAESYRASGADVIDVGCDGGDPWSGVGAAVRALRDAGHRVSIDSFSPVEVAAAVAAGAELVLSVNSSNVAAAADWGVEVVAVPDDPATLAGLDATVERLAARGVPLRIDPILEPVGCGFAASLGRYLEVRRRYGDAAMMMGVGNLTELTDVDSAGVNTLLLGFCQEVGVGSVLTTEVINWARTSVRECDVARRLAYHAVAHRTPPKRLDERLVMLRDARREETPPEGIAELAAKLRDPNYRIFASAGEVHVAGAALHLHDRDPFTLMEGLVVAAPERLTPQHAFYLGYEMCKAAVALTLGKNYRQDEALDWGLATQPEERHYLAKRPRSAPSETPSRDSP